MNKQQSPLLSLTMHTMHSSHLSPVLSFLVLAGFVSLIAMLFLLVKAISFKMSGWKSITQRFPMKTIDPTGLSFRNQNGVVGNLVSGGSGSGGLGFFDIHFAQQGVAIYPKFARRNPCLIPWGAIRQVAVSERSLSVVVDYATPFEFFVPLESLPIFQYNVSPQVFHKALSPVEVSREMLRVGARSKLLSAIGTRAVMLAETEYEKENQLSIAKAEREK